MAIRSRKWIRKVYLLDYDEEKKADALRCFSLENGIELWRRWYSIKVKRNHGMSRTIPAVTEKYVVKIKKGFNVIALFNFDNIKNPEISVFEEDFVLNKSDDYLYISNSDEVNLDIEFVDYYNFNLNSSSEFIKSVKLLNIKNNDPV